jgi:hypothetical protein
VPLTRTATRPRACEVGRAVRAHRVAREGWGWGRRRGAFASRKPRPALGGGGGRGTRGGAPLGRALGGARSSRELSLRGPRRKNRHQRARRSIRPAARRATTSRRCGAPRAIWALFHRVGKRPRVGAPARKHEPCGHPPRGVQHDGGAAWLPGTHALVRARVRALVQDRHTNRWSRPPSPACALMPLLHASPSFAVRAHQQRTLSLLQHLSRRATNGGRCPLWQTPSRRAADRRVRSACALSRAHARGLGGAAAQRRLRRVCPRARAECADCARGMPALLHPRLCKQTARPRVSSRSTRAA